MIFFKLSEFFVTILNPTATQKLISCKQSRREKQIVLNQQFTKNQTIKMKFAFEAKIMER
jgi:hypothetical protein